VGFLRRDKGDPAAGDQPAAAPGERAEIPDEERDGALEELEQIVVESMSDAPITRDMLELLQLGLPNLVRRECSEEAVVAGQTAARLGYLSRAAEVAMLDDELDTDAELFEALSEAFDQAEADGTSASDAMAELAAAIVIDESLDPSAQEGGLSWTLPGLAGPARGRLRDGLVSRMKAPPDVRDDDLRRTWKYGYFLRALDELCED